MKRFTGLFLVAIISVLVLSGCGKSGELLEIRENFTCVKEHEYFYAYADIGILNDEVEYYDEAIVFGDLFYGMEIDYESMAGMAIYTRINNKVKMQNHFIESFIESIKASEQVFEDQLIFAYGGFDSMLEFEDQRLGSLNKLMSEFTSEENVFVIAYKVNYIDLTKEQRESVSAIVDDKGKIKADTMKTHLITTGYTCR